MGTDKGFYRTTDGGTNWSQSLFADVSDIVVNSDLFNPANTVVNVAVQRVNNLFPLGGLRRSTNGGVSFAPLVTFPGLSTSFTGRMTLTNGVSHTNIYAAVSSGGGGIAGVWRSTDRGATWASTPNPPFTGGGQGFRNNAIAVDPVDPQRVLVGWNLRNIYLTTDGGGKWGTGSQIHEDIQQIMFDRNNRTNVYHVSDGGVFKSIDQGVKWDDAGGHYLPLAEIYHVTPSLTDPQGEWIGTQDNGISEGHDDFLAWVHRAPFDGGDILFHQDYVYVNITGLNNASSPFRWQRRKVNEGNDTWVSFTQGLPPGSPGLFPPAQIEFNGTNFYTRLQDTIYVALGTSLPWRPLGGSPRLDNQRIPWFYAAPNGYVFVGYEPGVSPLIRIYSPFANAWYSPSPGLPAGQGVTGFSAYQVGSSNVVFATLTGTTDDRIFKSTNNGQTWVSVTNDLPPMVNLTCVLVDRFNQNVLYVGSDFGVFGSANGGQNWVNISDGLPSTPVVNALSQRFNGEILAATYGRGVFAAARGVPTSAGGEIDLPKNFALDQNYPNPFNPLTSISFSIPDRRYVRLVVFDVRGRELETLEDGTLDAGRHVVRWNATRYASGVYYYRLEAGTYRQTKKMILVK